LLDHGDLEASEKREDEIVNDEYAIA